MDKLCIFYHRLFSWLLFQEKEKRIRWIFKKRKEIRKRVREVRRMDTPTEENIGWSLLGYNAKFDCYHQRGTQC